MAPKGPTAPETPETPAETLAETLAETPAERVAEQTPPEPAEKRRNPLARLLVQLVVLAIIVGTLVAGAAAYTYDRFTREGPLGADTTVLVPPGTALSGIGKLLEDAGVVEDAQLFTVGVRLFNRGKSLRAGEYAFSAGVSGHSAASILQSGESVVRRLTVPEGLTVAEVRRLVDEADAMDGTVPNSVGEGTLLPETYHYAWGDDRAALVARMEDAMDAVLAELWDARAADLPFDSADQALILASIVEKETGVAGERARVAAVFVNRLRKGMRLQSDPTVVYGLTQGNGPLGRSLTRRDLAAEHAYNTYVIDGLPPGPIANPGRASVAAVLNPAETHDLYFVADGSGGHAFAETLPGHNRNVARWRRLQREKARASGGG